MMLVLGLVLGLLTAFLIYAWSKRKRRPKLTLVPDADDPVDAWVLTFRPHDAPGGAFKVLGEYTGKKSAAMEACMAAVGMMAATTGDTVMGQYGVISKAHFVAHAKRQPDPPAGLVQ